MPTCRSPRSPSPPSLPRIARPTDAAPRVDLARAARPCRPLSVQHVADACRPWPTRTPPRRAVRNGGAPEPRGDGAPRSPGTRTSGKQPLADEPRDGLIGFPAGPPAVDRGPSVLRSARRPGPGVPGAFRAGLGGRPGGVRRAWPRIILQVSDDYAGGGVGEDEASDAWALAAPGPGPVTRHPIGARVPGLSGACPERISPGSTAGWRLRCSSTAPVRCRWRSLRVCRLL